MATLLSSRACTYVVLFVVNLLQSIYMSRSLLSKEELAHLQASLEQDDGILKHSYGVNDGRGRNSRLCLWNHPGNDITGMVGRCEKVACTMEKVLKLHV